MKVLNNEAARVAQREKDMGELNDEERRLMTGAQTASIEPGSGESLEKFRRRKAKTVAKTNLMKKWSEKVMYACYYLLMNLAEDLSVEKKMLKRNLLESLVTHLRTAHSLQLLTVIVAFLKKLAAFEDNKVDRDA